MDAPPALPTRPLGRAGTPISPLVWQLDEGPHPHLGDALRAADWLYLPSHVPPEALAHLPPAPSVHLIAGVTTAQLLDRDRSALRRRLQSLRPSGCAAVLLEDADPGELKNGRPYQRLAGLRDEGLVKLIFLEASDVQAAVWLTENTAAHAVVAPFGLANPAALDELLPGAAELGTAVIARRPREAAWSPPQNWTDAEDVAFGLADPRVAAVLLAIPRDAVQLAETITAASQPSAVERRDAWLATFRQQVPRPVRPRRAAPPE